MVLENYSYTYGLYTTTVNRTNLFYLVSSPKNVLTYDQRIGSYRNIYEGELPLDINGFIEILPETPDKEQTKIILSTDHTPNYYPFVYSTIITKIRITALNPDGIVLMTDQKVENGYSWKLILYPDKLQLRKFDNYDWNPESFDYRKDSYISVEINHNFSIGDDLIIVIRFTENNNIETNPDNLMELDLKVNNNILSGVSSSFNYNILTDGIINFYDLDKKFPSEFLLKSCIKLFERMSDSDVDLLLANDSEIDTVTSQDVSERERINYVRRKTTTIPNTHFGFFEIISDTEVPNNKKLYIHGLQIRVNNAVGGEFFIHVIKIYDNSNNILYEFQGIFDGTSLVIPDGGYWTLDTPRMGLGSNIGPYGFKENGVSPGTGIKAYLNMTYPEDIYITVYYTIE